MCVRGIFLCIYIFLHIDKYKEKSSLLNGINKRPINSFHNYIMHNAQCNVHKYVTYKATEHLYPAESVETM